MLSQGRVNSVNSEHFTQGYRLFENIIKDNPQTPTNQLQKQYGTGLVWEVATISEELQKQLKSKTATVWISDQTLLKQIHKHQINGVTIDMYQYVNEIIHTADEVIFENELNVVFFKKDEKWYKVAIKVTMDRKELYMTSFHPAVESYALRKIGERTFD